MGLLDHGTKIQQDLQDSVNGSEPGPAPTPGKTNVKPVLRGAAEQDTFSGGTEAALRKTVETKYHVGDLPFAADADTMARIKSGEWRLFAKPCRLTSHGWVLFVKDVPQNLYRYIVIEPPRGSQFEAVYPRLRALMHGTLDFPRAEPSKRDHGGTPPQAAPVPNVAARVPHPEARPSFLNRLMGLLGLRTKTVRKPSLNGPATSPGVRARFRAHYDDLVRQLRPDLSPQDLEWTWYYLDRDFLGHGPIDVLIKDPLIEDISCTGVGGEIHVVHRLFGSIATNIRFHDSHQLDEFVIRLGEEAGKFVSLREPIVSGTLRDGSRLEGSLPEVSKHGSAFTIRKFSENPFTIADLIASGTLTPRLGAYIWLATELGLHAMVCGSTGSGKTTLLNGMLNFIPRDKKIVSIEDTREVRLFQSNWTPYVTRRTDNQGVEIDMFRLIKIAMRSRPNYIIVGEVRDKEALNLFQAMASGHTTYSTFHADSVAALVNRLEGEPIRVPRNSIAQLNYIIIVGEVKLKGETVRRVKHLFEIVGMDFGANEILTNRVFSLDLNDGSYEMRFDGSLLQDTLQNRRGFTKEGAKAELERRAAVLEALSRLRPDAENLFRVVQEYSIHPAEVCAQLGVRP